MFFSVETSVADDGYHDDDDRTGSFPMSFATGGDIPEVGRRALPPARLNDTESPEAQPRPKGPPTNIVCGEDGSGGAVYPPSLGRSDGGRRSPIDGRHLPSYPPKSSTVMWRKLGGTTEDGGRRSATVDLRRFVLRTVGKPCHRNRPFHRQYL